MVITSTPVIQEIQQGSDLLAEENTKVINNNDKPTRMTTRIYIKEVQTLLVSE